MKIVRFVTFLIVVILIVSAWTPAPVFAKANAVTATIGAKNIGANVASETVKKVKLTVNNKTGGTLYVTLIGQKFYSFVVPNQGKTRFDVEAGKYTVNVTVSGAICSGGSTRRIKLAGDGSIGRYYCNEHLVYSR